MFGTPRIPVAKQSLPRDRSNHDHIPPGHRRIPASGFPLMRLDIVFVGAPETSPYRSSTRFPFVRDKNHSRIRENGFDSRSGEKRFSSSPRLTQNPLVANFVPVGAPGIEPGPYAPKAYILPLYYAPLLQHHHNTSFHQKQQSAPREHLPLIHQKRFCGEFFLVSLSLWRDPSFGAQSKCRGDIISLRHYSRVTWSV